MSRPIDPNFPAVAFPTPRRPKAQRFQPLPSSPEGKRLDAILAKSHLKVEQLNSPLSTPTKLPSAKRSINFDLRAEEEDTGYLKGRLFDSPERSSSEPKPESLVKRKRGLEAEEEDLDIDFPPKKSPALSLAGSSSSIDSLPPDTPVKLRRSGSKAPVEMPSIFTQTRRSANLGKITVNGLLYTLAHPAKGSYMDVYKLNDNEVIKIFNEEISSNPRKAESYLKTILKNYQKTVALGIPVAKILNADTALKDGYIKQEYIPEAINPSDSNQFNQIRAIFLCGMRNNIPLDLAPSNLRVRDGRVYLIDFVEESDEEMEGAKMFTLDALGKWAIFYAKEAHKHGLTPEEIKNSTTAFINSLTESFEQYLYNYDEKIDVMAFNQWKEGIVATAYNEVVPLSPLPRPIIFG